MPPDSHSQVVHLVQLWLFISTEIQKIRCFLEPYGRAGSADLYFFACPSRLQDKVLKTAENTPLFRPNSCRRTNCCCVKQHAQMLALSPIFLQGGDLMRQSRAPPKPPLPADAADCLRPDSATLPLVRAFFFSRPNNK